MSTAGSSTGPNTAEAATGHGLPSGPPIGSHIPVTGGLATGGIRYTREIGAEAIQVFVSNPRGWALTAGSPDEDAKLRAYRRAHDLPVFVHAMYLVNLGSPSRDTLRRSVDAVRHALTRGREIGAAGVVVHTGSAVTQRRDAAMSQIRDHLLPVLDEIPPDGPNLLLEPMAGQGRMLCATVQDLGPYLDALDRHPRAGVCFDTCHAFAAGHDLAAPDGVRDTIDALVETVGAGRLQLIHANDSKDTCGSGKDRHDNIGAGYIGSAPFARLLEHPATAGVPLVVETPGRTVGHTRDIAALKGLRRGVTPGAGAHRLGEDYSGGPSPGHSW